MEQDELLHHAVQALESLGLRYLVTGSVATIYYGEPRFTNDIDIVVELPANRVDDLCAAFPAGEFYVSAEAARQAVERHSQFNVIHPASGLKVDLMVASGDASPEDVILKTLEYYREGGSEKHLRDIAGVLKISGEQVDRAYIADWAKRLGLLDLWKELLTRVAEA